MAIIYSYPTVVPKVVDKLIITQTYDSSDEAPVEGNPTRSAAISDILALVGQAGTANTLSMFSGAGLVDSLVSQANAIVYIGTQASGTRFTNTSISTPVLLGTDLYAANIYGQNGGLLNIQGNAIIGNEATDTLTVNSVSTFNADVTALGNATFGDDDSTTVTIESTLDVQGPVSDAGGNLGTAGQVLSSTGGGSLSWADITGGTVKGTGAVNFVPKWSATDTLQNSTIFDSGTKVGINTITPLANLDVKETINDVAGEIIVGGLISSDDMPFGKLSFANTSSANTQPNKILASIEGRKNGSSNRGILTFGVADGSGGVLEKMRIDSNGRIGIQTDSPDRELDVDGGVRIRHTLDLFQGNNNSFAGQDAGNLFNIVAGSNTGFGKNSQLVNLSGSSNTSMGLSSLEALITGNNNTAIGTNSMKLSNGSSQNVALGGDTLLSATGGNSNTAIGYSALKSKIASNFNTAVGNESLSNITTGFRNTAVGNEAGKFINDGTAANATGNYSVFIGDSAKALSNGQNNQIVIGYDAVGYGSNTATLGGAGINDTYLRGGLHLGSYAGSQQTGTPTYLLGTNAAGDVVKTSLTSASNSLLSSAGGASFIDDPSIKTGNIPLRSAGTSSEMVNSIMSQSIGTQSAKFINLFGRLNISGNGGDANGGTVRLTSTSARLGICTSDLPNGQPEASLDVGKNARVRGSLNVGLTNEQYLFVSTTGDQPVGNVKMGYYGNGTDYSLSGDNTTSCQYTTAFANGGRLCEDERIMTFKLTRSQIENLDSDPKTLIAQDSNFNYIIKEAYMYQINNGGTSPVFSGPLYLEYSSVTGGITRADIAYTIPAANWNQSRTQKRVMFFDKTNSVSQVGGTSTVPRSAVILKTLGTPTPGSGSVDYYIRMRVKNIDLYDDIINNAQLITVA